MTTTQVRSGLYWALTPIIRCCKRRRATRRVRLINDEEIDVVVSDLHLPPNVDDIAEGLALIDIARAQDPPLQVVVITGSDSKRARLEALSAARTASLKSRSIRRVVAHRQPGRAHAATRDRESPVARRVVAPAGVYSFDRAARRWSAC